MGSSVSHHNSNKSLSSSTSTAMQQSITQQAIPTSGTQSLHTPSCTTKPLKGILKNKTCVQKVEKIEKPVKIVEMYVLRGTEWKVTRVREDEVDLRKKELKTDKTVKRVYTKPTHDQTFLHFHPF